MITYLRMSPAWHKGIARPGSPQPRRRRRGCRGRPWLPGRALGTRPGPRRHPQTNTMMAARHALPDGRVLDGMHRIARAIFHGSKEIVAVRFPALPEPDYRGCQPADLPY